MKTNPKVFLIAGVLAVVATAYSAEIIVPNGDFSNPANNGTVGSAPPDSGDGGVQIGNGPWRAVYEVRGGANIPPPTVSIENGQARISGVAGVPDAQGDGLNNGAWL